MNIIIVLIVMVLQWLVFTRHLVNRYQRLKRCSNKSMVLLRQSNRDWQNSLCRVLLSRLKSDLSFIVKSQKMDFVYSVVKYLRKIREFQRRLPLISSHISQSIPQYTDVRISFWLSHFKSYLKIMISLALL